MNWDADKQATLPQSTEAEAASSRDVTPAEMLEMAKTYLKIPLALILVEIVYRMMTASQNALGWIQVLEARVWNWSNEVIYGEGTSELVMHKSGLMTQVELQHETFPTITNNRILLYVSDECAGVHEMLFLGTLILLSPSITGRVKAWSILVLSIIVAILNLLRLVVLFPLAVNGCESNPNASNCAASMWDFHTFVFEWGFLMTLTVMWLGWFMIIRGPAAIRKSIEEGEE